MATSCDICAGIVSSEDGLLTSGVGINAPVGRGDSWSITADVAQASLVFCDSCWESLRGLVSATPLGAGRGGGHADNLCEMCGKRLGEARQIGCDFFTITARLCVVCARDLQLNILRDESWISLHRCLGRRDAYVSACDPDKAAYEAEQVMWAAAATLARATDLIESGNNE